MKVVVVGASGTIGSVLMDALAKSEHDSVPFERDQVDMDDDASIRQYLDSLNPTLIYHLGKSTIEFTRTLAQWAYENETTLIFTSSFKVFSGKKVEGPYSIYDTPDGTDSFAKEKIAQEQILFDYYPFTYVVRLSWQIAQKPEGYTFLAFMKDQIDKRGPFKASHDQYLSFMFIEDTAKYLVDLPFNYPPGLYHLNSNEFYSMYDVLMNLKEHYDLEWLTFNDKKKLSKNDLLENNVKVKTFSDYGFAFYKNME